MRATDHYRSFLWPAVFILAGILALLVNTGAIPIDHLDLLLNLWPLILVVIGLELIVRHSVQGLAGEVAAVLIVLVAVAGAVAYVAVAPSPNATQTIDASGSIGGLEAAALEVDVGSATIDLSGADLGSDLYRAHVEYSGPTPSVDFNQSSGTVKISQPNPGFFGNRKFQLTLQLNTAVSWTVTENTGATSDTINLSQLHVGSLRLNTGASHEEITLGPLSGTVPVEINGGALTVHVHRPAGVETSVQVSGGAVNLTADGRSFHAIGKVAFTSDGYGDANDRYRITVNGGACTVTLDAIAPLG